MARYDVLTCGSCGHDKLKVVDSRDHPIGGVISKRRSRKCLNCDHRQTSWEIADNLVEDGEIGQLVRELTDD